MIFVELLGGLGNQMFQYAAARALADQLACDVRFDLRAFNSYTLRTYELHRWNVTGKPATKLELKNFPLWQRKGARRLEAFGWKTKFYKEPFFGHDPQLALRRCPLHMAGYFQSEKYFAGIREKLLSEFSPSSPIPADTLTLRSRVLEHTSVSVHVRRGDYASDPHTRAVHGLCDPSYYRRAMDLLHARIGPATFFVFSDDIEWAKGHIRGPGELVYVDGQTTRPELDIHLMSACHHNICANSSFSWWGAWLNRNPAKIVVTPGRWFAADVPTRDLIPSDWLRLT